MVRVRQWVLVAAALTATACGRNRESSYAEKVADAVPRLEKTVGLEFKTPPKFEARSRDDVRQFLERRFAEDLPDEELRGTERAYKRFGMLPDTLDLKKFMLALLTEQIAGYYDPSTKVLYIVQGASDEMVSITLAHELVHALQDQHFNLDSLQKVRNRNDRQVAAQAVIEGQATLEQISSMIGGGNSLSNLPGGWDRVRELIRDGQNSMPVFAGAPILIQETLLFPYLSGAEFMKGFKEKNPGKVVFSDMPVSTEQVMHEDRFFISRDEPTTVTLPVPDGARAVYENDLGEFETRLFLFQHLKDRDTAYRGAAGWDGDRFLSYQTARGDALVWVSVWDTSIDAAEFYDIMDTALLKRFENLKPSSASQTRRVYTAGNRTIAVSVSDVGGRPIVIYADVPAGSNPDVLDVKKISLDER
jgi:hypothetical protein